jgi:hypothetical protein
VIVAKILFELYEIVLKSGKKDLILKSINPYLGKD